MGCRRVKMFKNDDILHSRTFYRMSTSIGAFYHETLYLDERSADRCELGWMVHTACSYRPYRLPWQTVSPALAGAAQLQNSGNSSCLQLLIYFLYIDNRPPSLKSHMAGEAVTLVDRAFSLGTKVGKVPTVWSFDIDWQSQIIDSWGTNTLLRLRSFDRGTNTSLCLRSLDSWVTNTSLRLHSFDSWGTNTLLRLRSFDSWGTNTSLRLRSYDSWGTNISLRLRSFDSWGANTSLRLRSFDSWGANTSLLGTRVLIFVFWIAPTFAV